MIEIDFQPEVFWPSWMVSTDTYGRGGDMGESSVAPTWSSAVDGWQASLAIRLMSAPLAERLV